MNNRPVFLSIKAQNNRKIMEIINRMTRKNNIKKVGKGFKDNIGRISNLVASGKRNEEETRRWCIDVLKGAMGYKDDEIETESKVLGKRVDIALKKGNSIFMVIECKAASVKLNSAAINQSASYAIALGAEWAVVTNGHQWMLHHVSPSRGGEPDIVQIFDISILDDDGVSDYDAMCLYLLTLKAIENGDTKHEFHSCNCATAESLFSALVDDETMTFISKKMEYNYKKNMGIDVSVDKEVIAEYIKDIQNIVFFG